MELRHAVEYVQALADGIDPNTGEIFPADHVFQHPNTVRALMTVLRVAEPAVKKKARKDDPNRPAQEGQAWTKEADEALAADFKAGMKATALMVKYGRSRGGIGARLARLGLIKERQDLRD